MIKSHIIIAKEMHCESDTINCNSSEAHEETVSEEDLI